MGPKCVVQGCSARNASLHSFPDQSTDAVRRKAWITFVQSRRDGWTGPTSSKTYICDEHFTPACFINNHLTRTAVPSIHPWSWEIDGDDVTPLLSTVTACKLNEVICKNGNVV